MLEGEASLSIVVDVGKIFVVDYSSGVDSRLLPLQAANRKSRINIGPAIKPKAVYFRRTIRSPGISTFYLNYSDSNGDIQ
jgi:hypothetical protein